MQPEVERFSAGLYQVGETDALLEQRGACSAAKVCVPHSDRPPGEAAAPIGIAKDFSVASMWGDSPIAPEVFRALLLDWYRTHGRALPWRTTTDPYKIWLSEVILQQTRVAQGLPYYARFVEAYPTVTALARATEGEVLRLWQGLGYYSRARNLLRCARTLVEKEGGRFPATAQALRSLPGIGPYTAAAIAAVAFKEVVAAVDGNVYRVLARLFGLPHDISTQRGKTALQDLANRLVDPLRPDAYSQAIMDFGALHCTPTQPACATCVFKPYCRAYRTQKQHAFPVKSGKTAKRVRHFDYVVVEHRDRWYMKKRAKGDIWQGMYDFHLIESDGGLHVSPAAQEDDPLLCFFRERATVVALDSPAYATTRLLSHQKLLIRFHRISLAAAGLQEAEALLQSACLQPFSFQEIENLPKPRAVQEFWLACAPWEREGFV